ncbi:unnamed protein product [Gadus morhua 'NCC']
MDTVSEPDPGLTMEPEDKSLDPRKNSHRRFALKSCNIVLLIFGLLSILLISLQFNSATPWTEGSEHLPDELDACELTLDPKTTFRLLSLSEDNRKVTRVEEDQSVGVYLDRPAGSLSFYRVSPGGGGSSDTLTHLHTFWSSFAQEDLLPGVGIWRLGSSVSVIPRVGVFWRRDGQELHEQVDPGEVLPNHDGTFHVSVDLKLTAVPQEVWGMYECVVQLKGIEDIPTPLDPALIRTNGGKTGVGGDGGGEHMSHHLHLTSSQPLPGLPGHC